MNYEVGKFLTQSAGYKAFIPHPFPPANPLNIPHEILIKLSRANRLIGKLDGITHTLPDVDFFLKMYVTKDATSSAQIEGTQASMMDAIERAAGMSVKESDADDILFYIRALHFGLKKLQSLPISQRLICEIHSQLMTGARSTQFSDPGQFRKSQNWIGGTSPKNAFFVPPPPHELLSAMSDIEKFLHKKQTLPILLQTALMHAQFETIHPFLDGNGRTGRLLITMHLQSQGLLEQPVLFLSSYFKKHQKTYYQTLDAYHSGQIEEWVNFFLDGVIDTANESIEISKKLRQLRDSDMSKLLSLAKRESQSGIKVLTQLFAEPIATSTTIMKWTGYTRSGAQRVLDRFEKLEILHPREKKGSYERSYSYANYLALFS